MSNVTLELVFKIYSFNKSSEKFFKLVTSVSISKRQLIININSGFKYFNNFDFDVYFRHAS